MKKFYMLLIVLCSVSFAAKAGELFNFNDYYSTVKLTNSTGGGKVYATTTSGEESASQDGATLYYVEAHENYGFLNLNRRGVDVTWTVGTEAEEGYEFLYWKSGDNTILTDQEFNATFLTEVYTGTSIPTPQGDYDAIYAKVSDLYNLVDDVQKAKMYKLTDLTCVHVAIDNAGNATLYCKDDNAYANKDQITAGEKDYVLDVAANALGVNKTFHDQSNWVVLHLDADKVTSVSDVNALQNQTLSNVVGTLTDAKNPEMTLEYMPEAVEAVDYEANTYLPCNFIGTQKDYFFVSPKPMEVAQICWAVYNGDNTFKVVPKQGSYNSENLEGAFEANFSLAEELWNEQKFTLQTNKIYNFMALIKNEVGPVAAQGMAAPAQVSRVVYPLSIPVEVGSINDQGVVTGINDIDAQVVSVKFYNMAGMESATPHQGINIVVETLSNGMTKSTKKMF